MRFGLNSIFIFLALSTVVLTTASVADVKLASDSGQAIEIQKQDRSDQLNAEMKKMGFNFKRSFSAKTLDELQDYVNKFRAHAEKAKKTGYSKDPEAFQTGITKLLTNLSIVQDSINAGDFDLAKKKMKALNDIRKKYHGKFDV